MKKLPVVLFVATLFGACYASYFRPVLEFTDIFKPIHQGEPQAQIEVHPPPVSTLQSPWSAEFDREEEELKRMNAQNDATRERDRLAQEKEFFMQAGMSLVVCCASLFVILANRFAPTDRHWAYATVGTLLGFWLRGAH
jgi:hypothetical protein